MKITTTELIGYIKERHYRQVRALAQPPVLAVIMVGSDGPSLSFVRSKQRYGQDIGAIVTVETATTPQELLGLIKHHSANQLTRGIVVQLPLPEGYDTDEAIEAIDSAKDIDGLRPGSTFEPPTAKGIIWILGSLDVAMRGAKVAVVGQGRLVGRPIAEMLEASGAQVRRLDDRSKDIAAITRQASLIVTATGRPGLITADHLSPGAIVIDAGTAESAGAFRGDVDPSLYDHPDIRVTPVPGGVGPMTVAALFDNLLIAASTQA